MTNEEIHGLADKHKDAYIYEGVDIIGYEFALTSAEKLCREAYNAGLEAAAKECEKRQMVKGGEVFAAAIRKKITHPAPAVQEFTCPYCKHEQPYAEIYCHNCNAKYTVDAAPEYKEQV